MSVNGALRAAAALGGGAVSDPYFSNVIMLLHCDGASSTTLTDSCNSPNTFTSRNSAAMSSTQKKFGDASAYFNGTNQYFDCNYNSNIGLWNNGDFTIEMWVYNNANRVASIQSIPLQFSHSATYWAFGTNASGQVEFYYWNGSAVHVTTTSTVSLTTWTHIAMTLSGSTIRLFNNGSLDKEVAVSGTPQNASASEYVGYVNSSSVYYSGYIDDLRITDSVARYTATFTPPTAAFPDK